MVRGGGCVDSKGAPAVLAAANNLSFAVALHSFTLKPSHRLSCIARNDPLHELNHSFF